MALQIIQSIAYVNLNELVSFYPFPNGSVNIEVTDWTPIPMHPASGEMNTTSRTDAAGISYTTAISVRLKTDIKLPDAIILLVTLCSGKQLVIGSPDLPVRVNKNQTLSLSILSINYTSFHQPLEVI